MEVYSNWYDKVVKEINLRKDSLSKKEAKKYKLDLLLRIAGRVDHFSAECGQCQLFQQEITTLTQDLGNLVQMPDKAKRQSYLKTINNTVKHLQNHHKLITPGHNIGVWISLGTGIGVAIGAGMGNIAAGIPIGIAIGVAIGSYLDKKAKKEGRVI